MRIKSSVVLWLGILFCFPFGCKKQLAEKPKKEAPNVLIIYPDQLRRYSAGYWSQEAYAAHALGKPDPVVTPNIDHLAKNGVVCTQAISNFPLCSPARGMIMSGRYPEQNGIWNNCRIGRDTRLKDSVATLTDLFHESGYRTAYFGKCHWMNPEPVFDTLGNYVGGRTAPGGHYANEYDTYVPPGPSRHSIDYFYQTLKDAHYDPLVYSNDPDAVGGKADGQVYRPNSFTPELEADRIIDYLKKSEGADKVRTPFFMFWSINPPHAPWDDANTDMAVVEKYYGTDKYPEIDSTLVVRDNAVPEVADHARNYFGNVTSVDYHIGRVLNQLKASGEFDNTIVLFSSDHGEMLGSQGTIGKNIIEMEALAVPMIVHWPKGLRPGISDVLFSVPDVLPTLMGLAGLSEKTPKDIEGHDHSPHLSGQNDLKGPESALLMLYFGRGILTDRYTLSIAEDKKGTKVTEAFLYDHQEDPYEKVRIPLKERPQVAAGLLAKLAIHLKATNDPWYQNKRHNTLIPYPEQ